MFFTASCSGTPRPSGCYFHPGKEMGEFRFAVIDAHLLGIYPTWKPALDEVTPISLGF